MGIRVDRGGTMGLGADDKEGWWVNAEEDANKCI
jgi:hypothetical protein